MAMLWAQDALRDIPDEVIKNCWRKASILLFEVNQRYIEDKEKVSKGHAQMQNAADHHADLLRRLYMSSILCANRGGDGCTGCVGSCGID